MRPTLLSHSLLFTLYGFPFSRFSGRWSMERPEIFDGVGRYFAIVYPEFAVPKPVPTYNPTGDVTVRWDYQTNHPIRSLQ